MKIYIFLLEFIRVLFYMPLYSSWINAEKELLIDTWLINQKNFVNFGIIIYFYLVFIIKLC